MFCKTGNGTHNVESAVQYNKTSVQYRSLGRCMADYPLLRGSDTIYDIKVSGDRKPHWAQIVNYLATDDTRSGFVK